MPLFLGLDGVWLAMPISNVVLSAVVVPLMWSHILRQRQKMNEAIYLLQRPIAFMAGNITLLQ